MRCTDPLVKAFKRLGYNVIKLPSTEFRSLLLVESDGRHAVRGYGPLERSLPGSTPLPVVHLDDPAPAIDVRTTNELQGKAAADFLGPVLAAMGASPVVSLSLGTARSTRISLRDTRRDWVSMDELATYLEAANTPATNHLRNVALRNELFVVTAILKSDEFTVLTDRSVAETIGASVPITGPVSVSMEASGKQAKFTSVHFKGAESLAFAFQAVQLLYEDGQYVDYCTAHGLSGFALEGSLTRPVEGMLLVDDDLVEVPLESQD